MIRAVLTIRAVSIITLTYGLLAISPASAGVQNFKRVRNIQVDTRPCVFFELDGVSQADPVVNGDWFALPRSAANFDLLNAMLLSARLTNTTISVQTDGTTSCGWATVFQINNP